MNVKDLIVTTHTQMLQVLDGLLKKAEADDRGDALLAARLADDMHPLATQVRFLCNMPGEALVRLAGAEFTSSDDDPATLPAAREMVAQTIARIEQWATGTFVADDSPIELTIPNGMTFDLTAAEYVRDWALPQYHFHATTAYAILRSEGLELGKADYVGYMFRYIRPPAES